MRQPLPSHLRCYFLIKNKSTLNFYWAVLVIVSTLSGWSASAFARSRYKNHITFLLAFQFAFFVTKSSLAFFFVFCQQFALNFFGNLFRRCQCFIWDQRILMIKLNENTILALKQKNIKSIPSSQFNSLPLMSAWARTWASLRMICLLVSSSRAAWIRNKYRAQNMASETWTNVTYDTIVLS